jgi:RimJ/RimL family protein N-acetyltransferase
MIELRELDEGDIQSIASYANNFNVSQYMASRMPYPYTLDDAQWWVRTGSKEQGLNFAIDLEGTCIGVIGVRLGENEYQHSAEIGYWIAEEHWGKGIGTEAVSKMTNHVFAAGKIVRLSAPVRSPNNSSMRILEKNGYVLESVQKKSVYKNNEFMDEHIYVKLRS